MKLWPFRSNNPRRSTQSGPSANDWTYIGGYGFGISDMEQVPRWVRSEIRKLDSQLSAAASKGRHIELEGKTYRYRLQPGWHGSPVLEIYRRRRGRKSR